MLARLFEPCFILGNVLVVIGREQNTGPAKSRLRLQIFIHALPEPQTFDHQRELPRVTLSLPYPAPVPTGLLPCNIPFVAQRYFNTMLRQKERCTRTNDAPTDNSYVNFRR